MNTIQYNFYELFVKYGRSLAPPLIAFNWSLTFLKNLKPVMSKEILLLLLLLCRRIQFHEKLWALHQNYLSFQWICSNSTSNGFPMWDWPYPSFITENNIYLDLYAQYCLKCHQLSIKKYTTISKWFLLYFCSVLDSASAFNQILKCRKLLSVSSNLSEVIAIPLVISKWFHFLESIICSDLTLSVKSVPVRLSESILIIFPVSPISFELHWPIVVARQAHSDVNTALKIARSPNKSHLLGRWVIRQRSR